ncbi:MAG: hypothetical protein HN368_03990 [Spirochaetales bacterium]|jgi:hypothetical protein|nr:hypothetical protein [Spirochaetales bacterium]
MDSRERFWRVMRFEQVDYIPFWGDWLGPYDRWISEGMKPANDKLGDVEQVEWFSQYFDFDGIYSAFWGTSRVPVDIGVCPAFDRLLIEETDKYIISRNDVGCITRRFKTKQSSLTSEQFLDFPIKRRDDWEQFRDERLDPVEPTRYPSLEQWNDQKGKLAAQTIPISIDGGSFYGFLRDWVGVENLSVMFYDDPNLVGDIMEYLGEFYIKVLSKALREVRVDFAMFWEDMCYKTGPLISPAMFKEFLLPNYKKVTSFLRSNGVELSWVDCDGNIEELIPFWIEGGVRGFYPLEVAAGMDANKLRKEYGQEIVMWGNVDKRALAGGTITIDAELARVEPAVKTGGFIPLVDHGVPDDVSLSNYLYYLEKRKRLSQEI